jgi:CheY-like chemotaxis protein
MAAQMQTSQRSWSVLVVDDNQDAADSLAELLKLSGHEVEIAYTGMSALARVRSRCPEIVLCDLGLPELSGYEFAKAIRRECPRTIRLVAISGYAQPEDIQRSMEAGFDAHVAKPAAPADIERWLT